MMTRLGIDHEGGANLKVFLAGGTGALGARLVPLLVERGHELTATTRKPASADRLREAGASPVVVDALSRDEVIAAVRDARPEVVVHQLTALAGRMDVRRFDRTFAGTNRLRTTGTDHLLEAAQAAGVRRFVAQSFGGWPYARTGGAVKTEADPLDPDPPRELAATLSAIRHLEAAVTDARDLEGLVLRYGLFYGPSTSLAPEGGEQVEMLRKRRWPIVGAGTGVLSFVHIDDAAAATAAAIEGGAPGIYNVVDDEPAPVSVFLPYLAEALGAKPPRRVPVWLGRLAAGEHGVTMMTSVRGASNAKAKQELGWTPRHASWREGFRTLAP